MKKMTKKQLENHISEIYRRIGNCIQVNIFDLSKIYKSGELAYANGECVETAMKLAIEKYRVN